MNLVSKLVSAVVQYRAFHAALKLLNQLSDRELQDMRLTRGDIARVAYEEAERRAGLVTSPRPTGRRADEHAVPHGRLAAGR